MSDPASPHRRSGRALPPLPWLAILLAAGAVILGGLMVMHLRAASAEPQRYVVTTAATVPPAAEQDQGNLERCRSQTDANDERCKALWEDRRRRFFEGK